MLLLLQEVETKTKSGGQRKTKLSLRKLREEIIE
jgi:hypothetical protein